MSPRSLSASTIDERHHGAFTAGSLEQPAPIDLLRSQRLAWVVSRLGISPEKLLDAGCGKGKYLPLWAKLFPECRISGCDSMFPTLTSE